MQVEISRNAETGEWSYLRRRLDIDVRGVVGWVVVDWEDGFPTSEAAVRASGPITTSIVSANLNPNTAMRASATKAG